MSEAENLKITITTLEERFSRSVQENEELRRNLNELNVKVVKMSQDSDFKNRSLSQEL